MDKVRNNLIRGTDSSGIIEDARTKTTVLSCEEKRRIICGDKGAGDGDTG